MNWLTPAKCIQLGFGRFYNSNTFFRFVVREISHLLSEYSKIYTPDACLLCLSWYYDGYGKAAASCSHPKRAFDRLYVAQRDPHLSLWCIYLLSGTRRTAGERQETSCALFAMHCHILLMPPTLSPPDAKAYACRSTFVRSVRVRGNLDDDTAP